MTELYKLIAPQLGVNDEFLKVVEWVAQPGDLVEKDEIVAVVETSKATSEIAAERSGYFYPCRTLFNEVPFHEPIAVIAATVLTDDQLQSVLMSEEKNSGPDEFEREGVRLTKKAKVLAGELGINPGDLPRDRIVKQADIHALVQARKADRSDAINYQKAIIHKIGNGSSTILETIRAMGGVEVVGFLDQEQVSKIGAFQGLPVYGYAELKPLLERGVSLFISGETDRQRRLEVLQDAERMGYRLLNAIHPRAYISPSVRMAGGNHVKASAVVDTGTLVGKGCIIDNGAIVPHHNIIGDGCHISPGVSMGSSIRLEARVLLGIGSSVATGVDIGEDAIVTPGSSITTPVASRTVMEGVPARPIGKRKLPGNDG